MLKIIYLSVLFIHQPYSTYITGWTAEPGQAMYTQIRRRKTRRLI